MTLLVVSVIEDALLHGRSETDWFPDNFLRLKTDWSPVLGSSLPLVEAKARRASLKRQSAKDASKFSKRGKFQSVRTFHRVAYKNLRYILRHEFYDNTEDETQRAGRDRERGCCGLAERR
ncbi:hypothetical protein V5799_006898 [Amblyomma americanum]|uniref:Uncharacterized protein n=1 Tax=Amblyomma americanum TaxID=6943 RepID=A0AAQ4DV20_AMBAM